MNGDRLGTYVLRRSLARRLDEILGRPEPAFETRAGAGRQLLELLPQPPGAIVVAGVGPGGVLAAEPIAERHDAPLVAIPLLLLRAPAGPDGRVLGAIAPEACRLLEENEVRLLGIQHWAPEFLAECGQLELEAQAEGYRVAGPAADLRGRPVWLVDDGLTPAVGLLAAVDSVRAAGAASVRVASPLLPDTVCRDLLAARVGVTRIYGDRRERSGIESALYGEQPPPAVAEAVACLRRAARRVPASWA